MQARHRGYRGRLVYCTGGVETGREWFAVTVLPDGGRTLHAQCEMDERGLLRDVVLSVAADWRPIDAYVRLTLGGATHGFAAYRFGEHAVEAEGWSVERGRWRSAETGAAGPIAFGSHALHNDSWTAARWRLHAGPPTAFRFVTHTCSRRPDGGSGPDLIAVPPGSAQVTERGHEPVECAAGRFDALHLRIEVPGVDDFDIWAAGADAIPVRLSSDGLGQTYALVELEGEWR